mmetsp:Transcript_89169/g.186332  ORF Transcript_89169/g.186332 Transcript_89169/m.186332 type:complete len:279 (-) Transcript_89169:187-1023(-)|eukprot:CAMPEP_0206438742 /NCGR_PEP_ID=MMETSP0324_2-20121206/11813_1 /ASSEMBLY_ACC=CAM_ASM_000836 /TAXON_ID=2866 /ORGANISM="Crypthecodinium cohnii, Strain Seligo" /LENGTH=278 /DNA_ID=CAMNT_0053906263 /DNA_START=51 /DNA_END=887 /DNA_ORIENTATION=-
MAALVASPMMTSTIPRALLRGSSSCRSAAPFRGPALARFIATARGKYGELVVYDETRSKFSGSVIFGHGLGDSPLGWHWQAAAWAKELPWLRFVLPCAPHMPVSLNGGMEMPAWYDIQGLGDRLQEPAIGADESRVVWAELLEAEASLVGGRDHVVIGGFSQGGAMALYTALQLDMMPLVAGILCMSGYLPNHQHIESVLAPGRRPLALADMPVLLCHGKLDPMVRLESAYRTRDALQDFGMKNVEFKEYKYMAHEVCEDEVRDVAEWLKQTLPPPQE